MQAGEYLKAAACYTKAIKAEPDNHVYYSNRSNAFLKLSKVGKALEDADKCISLNPEFVKGYHRKASALHAGDRSDEAAEVLLGAIEKGLDNNDLVRMGITIKGKGFVPLAAQRKPGYVAPDPAEKKENKEPAQQAPAQTKAQKSAPSAPAAGTPGQQHLYQLDPESFAGLMIQDVFKEVNEEHRPALSTTVLLRLLSPRFLPSTLLLTLTLLLLLLLPLRLLLRCSRRKRCRRWSTCSRARQSPRRRRSLASLRLGLSTPSPRRRR